MAARRGTYRAWRARGFTLAEALLASSILLTGVLSLTVPFAAGTGNDQASAKQTLAVALAQEMMDEILTRRFYDSEPNAVLGPEPNETSRAMYDSYDDYNGYTEAAGNIQTFQGVACSDPLAADLSRSVSVAYVHVPGEDPNGPCTFVLVTVKVFRGANQVVSLPRLVYFVP
jgi:Tfp pilus assembly protein PilV